MRELERVQTQHLFDEIADIRLNAVIENGAANRTNLINILEAYPKADSDRQKRSSRFNRQKSSSAFLDDLHWGRASESEHPSSVVSSPMRHRYIEEQAQRLEEVKVILKL